MCGIAGIAAFEGGAPPNVHQLKTMCNTIFHRGPDDEGIEISGNVGLAMRRLSIIDIPGGHQPMSNEDASISLVFNGEIYNFAELRRDLEARGHRFATRSDTEVIIHAYEEFGPSCVTRFNGMFAFSLHDKRRNRLFLARDHVGIKPLFYAAERDHLIWGSEIKVLLASGLIDPTLNVDALAQFLDWEYVPLDGTLITSIKKLEAGHFLDIDLSAPNFRPVAFWDVIDEPENHTASEQEWIEQVDAKLQECVKRQMVSDVPLGAFLSGGVDSSLMTAAMGNAQTFSIGFSDPRYNELPWASKVAQHLGVDHFDEVIHSDVGDLFDDLMYYMDDPIGDFSIFPTFLISRLARQHVKTVLGGDGGDELFGGYESYLAQNMAGAAGGVPKALLRIFNGALSHLKPSDKKKGSLNKLLRFAEGLSHDPALGHARWRLFTGEAHRQSLLTKEAYDLVSTPSGQHITDLFQKTRAKEPINRCLYVDLKSYLCDNILVKVDRMTMANSLEARVPYLDTELVELAFKIPDRYKVDRLQTKVLLKSVAERHIPRECVYRAKEGFSIPLKAWLKTDFRPMLEDLLDSKKLAEQGIFDSHAVSKLKNEHMSGAANHSHQLWAIMVFQAWQAKWLNNMNSALTTAEAS